MLSFAGLLVTRALAGASSAVFSTMVGGITVVDLLRVGFELCGVDSSVGLDRCL